MSSNFKPWLVLATIFIAGILTGAALAIVLPPYFQKPPAQREMRDRWVARLTERLKLTPDQQAKIQPIIADATTKIQALHHDEMERGRQIFKSTDDQISTLLTPDQQVELQKMEAEREKMFSGHLHRHGGPDDSGMPPPPVPPPTPNSSTNAAAP